jgi:hypothetical protein
VGIASFNGTQFISPSPVDTLRVTLNGTQEQDFPGTTFQINSGFAVTPGSTYVTDVNADGKIDNGDIVNGLIGNGSFKFSDGAGVVFSGTFTKGTFTGTIGSNSLDTLTTDLNGLVLTPGPAFTFAGGSSVSQILAPEGFSISLVTIPSPGVQATATGPELFFTFIPATLNAFGISNGSVDASGTIVVSVSPEPSSIVALCGLGAMGMFLFARRRRKS